MESVVNFIVSIIRHLLPLWPVQPWEGGVRTTGSHWRRIGPGWHFKWPLASQIHVVNTKRQTAKSPEFSVWTKDHVQVASRCLITYSIRHFDRVFIDVQDHDEALIERAMLAVARYINSHDFESLSMERVETALGSEIRKEGFRWGCEVEDFGLMELAQCKVVRHLGVMTPILLQEGGA